MLTKITLVATLAYFTFTPNINTNNPFHTRKFHSHYYIPDKANDFGFVGTKHVFCFEMAIGYLYKVQIQYSILHLKV